MSPKVDRVRLRARKNDVPLTKAERVKRRRAALLADMRARRAAVSASPLRIGVNIGLLVISVLGAALQFLEFRRHVQGAHGLWLAAYVLVGIYAAIALNAQFRQRRADRAAAGDPERPRDRVS